MATPDRDNLYRTEDRVYTREGNGTGWFVGIIVALALIAIGYLIFSANSGPGTTAVDGGGAVTAPADPAVAPAPMTDAAPMTEPAPAVEAPAAGDTTAPAAEPAPAVEAPAAPADAAPAGATTTPAQ